MSRKNKAQQAETANHITMLQTMLEPGTTVYTVIRHVSSSGMSRNIDVYAMVDNEPRNISYLVADVTDTPLSKDGSLRVTGCGMDMGFHIAYTLSATLYRDGFDCTGTGCPSNDHSNGDRDYTSHHHTSGGYAIKQRWM